MEIRSDILALDRVMISCEAAQLGEIALHNFSQKIVNLQFKDAEKHGAYRQFIKRDKRKNFK